MTGRLSYGLAALLTAGTLTLWAMNLRLILQSGDWWARYGAPLSLVVLGVALVYERGLWSTKSTSITGFVLLVTALCLSISAAISVRTLGGG